VTADSESEHELGSLGPNERLLVGAGNSVVSENRSEPVGLETIELAVVNETVAGDKEDVLSAGEGQIVTSVGNGLIDGAVASTDWTVDPFVGSRPGGKVVCANRLDDRQGESREVIVGVVCPSPEGDDRVSVMAVAFPPKLDCLDDQRGSASEAVDAVGNEEMEKVAEAVERGPGVTGTVDSAMVPVLSLASTVNAVVNATMVKRPGASDTVSLTVIVETTAVNPTTDEVGDARLGSLDDKVEVSAWYPPELDGQSVLLMMTTAPVPPGWPSVRVNMLGAVVTKGESVSVTVTTAGGAAEGEAEPIEDTTTRGELDERMDRELPVLALSEALGADA